MAAPILHAQVAWMLHPQELVERLVVLQSDLFQLHWHSLHRMLGLQHEEPVQPNPDDNRFNDPVWAESPTWDLVKDWYLTFTHRAQDMLYDTPALSARERRRAAFWWRKWLNAVAPTNFLWTNPVALRKAFETHGQSVMSGWQNFIADVQAGDVQMTAQANFEVGVNLATTSGAVVFRNNLLEVIHYTPTQPRIHAEPVVIVTPWINKFYILDLNPKKSMVRYLLDQGLDVFITSWRNPGPEMAETRFDDYLLDGVDTIVRVAREMSGAQRVHAVGYCIGGTALSIYMAWANSHYGADAMPVADWTLFTTLVDFRKPGDIEVFIDEGSVKHLCDQMGTRGYLDGREMAAAFRLLRSNSLIWHYVVHGWLYGESPAPFDVLFWNMDSTRMPRAMHSWYLTELYLHNRLVERGALTLAGESIDLTRITQPLYAVAAEDDHIAPWEQTFHVMNHVAGEKRYVLSSSGHILGIVNPPVKPPKRTFLAGEAHRADTPGAWKDRSPTKAGSWWEDWMAWLKPRAGELMEARPVVTKAYPRLADAPGTFVREA
ncbi:alpha/beta fold hydrolase [Zoogloea sp.]|uniref:PHA/PHB synthase family protein n=1 Tax=Zoogloea sp. TaxID=49181 RepID=UPI001ACDA16F|nr:alpha/beta fold hydrolase [Zoogloea sp.]MBN8283627.1 alpha/beta fold hydrolase [Zoogloea sp.]